MKRPWWLPEGVKPRHVLEAWDGEWTFRGSDSRSEFSPVNIISPVFVWDRELAEEEVIMVRDALLRDDYQAIMDMGPRIGTLQDPRQARPNIFSA